VSFWHRQLTRLCLFCSTRLLAWVLNLRRADRHNYPDVIRSSENISVEHRPAFCVTTCPRIRCACRQNSAPGFAHTSMVSKASWPGICFLARWFLFVWTGCRSRPLRPPQGCHAASLERLDPKGHRASSRARVKRCLIPLSSGGTETKIGDSGAAADPHNAAAPVPQVVART